MHDYESYAQIIADADEETLSSLRTLGALLGAAVPAEGSYRTWAARQLGAPRESLTVIEHKTTGTQLIALGAALGTWLEAHHDVITISGDDEGGAPQWSTVELGSGEEISIPHRMSIHFPTGSVSDVAFVVVIKPESYSDEIHVYSQGVQRERANRVLSQLLANARGTGHPLQGKVLRATNDQHELVLSVSTIDPTPRSSLVLSDETWGQVDLFLSAATTKLDALRALGLGTTRGLLVAGPPGTGKTHLTRVVSTELSGDFTVVVADSTSMRHLIGDIYAEAETFGKLLVILEDIDLVLGHRDHSSDSDALADFLAALDGTRQLTDVFTVATTNNLDAIDPAARRTARFDDVIEIPRPGARERAAILDRYLDELGVEVETLRVAAQLDGCTGSDVREVVRRSVLEAQGAVSTQLLMDVARSGRWRPTLLSGNYL